MIKLKYLLLMSLGLILSCRGGQPTTPTFYIIEYPKGSGQENPLEPLPYTIEVVAAEVNPAYSSHQIALREGSHQLRYFNQHQWATRPEQSVTHFISLHMNELEVFRKTDTRYWGEIPDYRIHTSVHQLQIVEQKKKFSANLSIEFRLVKAGTEGVVIAKHEANVTQELHRREVNLFADAISSLLIEELDTFTQKVQAKLSAR